MKRIFENCDTKEDLMNNQYMSFILQTVFGNETVGNDIIGGMFDELYNEL